MTFKFLRFITITLLILALISSCNSPKTNQKQINNSKVVTLIAQPKKGDTTFFELEKQTEVFKTTLVNVNTPVDNRESISQWRLITNDSLYTFQLLDIRYIISTNPVSYIFDTRLDSVQLINNLPGEISFGEQTVAKQQKALQKLKSIKGFTFSIIRGDSCYFRPSFKIPLQEITSDSEYNPAIEVKSHLNPAFLLSIFDKMLLQPDKSFIADSLYKYPEGTFIGSKFSNIKLKYTFKTNAGYITIQNTLDAKNKLINSEYSQQSSVLEVKKTISGQKVRVQTTTKVDAVVRFQ